MSTLDACCLFALLVAAAPLCWLSIPITDDEPGDDARPEDAAERRWYGRDTARRLDGSRLRVFPGGGK